ncbi:leucine rich repeat containing protein BspA family protein, partial [Entamoeba invadens IP1]
VYDSQCFMNCSKLKCINLNNNKTIFGNDVFEGCVSLESILFENQKLKTYSGEVSYTFYNQFKKKQIICENIKVKCNDLMTFGIDILKFQKVHSIDEGAFFNNTTITEIEIPNNITAIGNFCFVCATKLERVVLPLSITGTPSFLF